MYIWSHILLNVILINKCYSFRSFYLSADQYENDDYIRKLTNEDGGVKAEILVKFPRISQLQVTVVDVLKIVLESKSDFIEVFEGDMVSS